MNENKSTLDLTDSILRILGIIGFFAAVISGFVFAGGNLITLIHIPEIIIVVGTIFFDFYAPIGRDFFPTCPRHCLPVWQSLLLIGNTVKYLIMR